MKIAVISTSIRENPSTRKVALHLLQRLQQYDDLQPELVDLTAYESPIWKEVFHRETNPPALLKELHYKLDQASAMIFVTPEYNGSYSLALKNMVDYFGLKVFERKVIGVSSVSTGSLGGIRAGLQLQQLVLAIFAIPVPYMLLIPSVKERITDDGVLLDETLEKQVIRFLDDFFWYAHALEKQKDNA